MLQKGIQRKTLFRLARKFTFYVMKVKSKKKMIHGSPISYIYYLYNSLVSMTLHLLWSSIIIGVS